MCSWVELVSSEGNERAEMKKKMISNFYKTKRNKKNAEKDRRRAIKKIHVISASISEVSSWEFDAVDDDVSSKFSIQLLHVYLWNRNRTGNGSELKSEKKCFLLRRRLLLLHALFNNSIWHKRNFNHQTNSTQGMKEFRLSRIYATHRSLVSDSFNVPTTSLYRFCLNSKLNHFAISMRRGE